MKKSNYKNLKKFLNEMSSESMMFNDNYATYEQGANDAWKEIWKKLNPSGTPTGRQSSSSSQQTPERPKVNPLQNPPQQSSQSGTGEKGASNNQDSQEGENNNKQQQNNNNISKHDIEDNAKKTAEKTREYLEGYRKGLKDNLNGKNDDSNLSEETKQGYQDAQQEAKDFQDKTTPTVDGPTNNRFGKDRISKEEMKKLAGKAGQTIINNDNPEKVAQEFVNNQINGHFAENDQNNNTLGKGVGSLKDKMAYAVKKIKTEVDWKSRLRSHFNKAAKSKKKTDLKYYTSRIARDAINQYVKDNPKAGVSKNGISQIFYTVDGSGSMFFNKIGKDIFYYIMNEIFALEESANILNSSFCYFTDGLAPNIIKNGGVKRWSRTSGRNEKMKKIAYDKSSFINGGTDIVRAMKDIYKLPKPYFDNSVIDGTLLVVITDGEDNIKKIGTLPIHMKRKLLFVTINDKTVCKTVEETLKACDVPESNIISIDSDKVASLNTNLNKK